MRDCPHDGGRRTLKIRAGRRAAYWRCGTCKRSISALDRSIFAGSRLTIGTLLTMLLAFARGYSHEHTKGACLRTERQPVSNVALARWGSILRKIVSERVSRFPKIGGVGCTVQIDEALLGCRKYHVGRKLTRT